MKKVIYFYILMALIGLSELTHAKIIVLFANNKMAKNYTELIQTIKIGDVIVFSNNNEFTVKRILGFGKMNLIIEVNEVPDRILRIPLNENSQFTINETYHGFQELSMFKDDLVPIDFYLQNEMLIQKKLHGELMTVYNFIRYKSDVSLTKLNPFSKKYIHPKQLISMEESLFQFLEKYYRVSQLTDLNSSNLVYSFQEDRWIMIDWMAKNEMAKSINAGLPYSRTFSQFGYFLGFQFIALNQNHFWLQQRLNQLNQKVYRLRKAFFSGNICQNIFFAH